MFIPTIIKGELLKTVAFERHRGELWRDAQSDQGVEYPFLLAVIPTAGGKPVMFVAAEINPGVKAMYEMLKMESKPILCVVKPDQDMNMGTFSDCNVSTFLSKAIELVEELMPEQCISR